MPAEGCVQLRPEPLSGEIRLGGAALLAGAAEEDHGALGAGLLQIALHGAGRRERADAQQIVPAAVTVPARLQRLRGGLPRRLRKAGQRVKLAENADHGSAASKRAAEGGLDAAEPALDLEAELLQRLAVAARGKLLLERALRVLPDLVCERLQQRRQLVDRIEGASVFLFILTAPWTGSPSDAGSGDSGRCPPASPPPRACRPP